MSNELTPYKFLQQKAKRFNESRKDAVRASVVADRTEGRDDIGEKVKVGNFDYDRHWQFKFRLTDNEGSRDLFIMDHFASQSLPINFKPEPNGEEIIINSWEELDEKINTLLSNVP